MVRAQIPLLEKIRAPRVRVKITGEHIEEAIRGDSGHCMIADAVRDSVKGALAVSVDIQTIRWSDRNLRVRYVFLTPPTAQHAILAFDEGKKPSPFTINLRAGQIIRMRESGRENAARWEEWSKGKKQGKNGQQKATLTDENRKGAIPTIVGGNAPPTTHIGRRRIFGLRGYARRFPTTE